MGINGRWTADGPRVRGSEGAILEDAPGERELRRAERARRSALAPIKCPMCPLQPVELRILPVSDAHVRRQCNASSHCRITDSTCRVFPWATPVSSIAQLCDARAELAWTLKPFVACRNLIIVIPLYAWERIRVMTIKKGNGSRRDVQFSGDAGAVSGGWLMNGEGRADDSP